MKRRIARNVMLAAGLVLVFPILAVAGDATFVVTAKIFT
jgi:hypothetical protein